MAAARSNDPLLRFARELRGLARRALGKSYPDGGWEGSARERYVRGACDPGEVERRDRAWERQSSNAYGLARWL